MRRAQEAQVLPSMGSSRCWGAGAGSAAPVVELVSVVSVVIGEPPR